jgi:alpha-N-arabinofuranosidase
VFTNDEWYELLGNADRMESLIVGHWGVMGEIDREHRVKLIVDEWGAWHARWDKMPEEYLWAYPGTLRDALVAGLTLDTFNRHADKVAMANVAQLINTIHSLFLAYEDRFIVTPNFHVFEMYAAHQGAQAVRTLFSAPSITYTRAGRPAQLWGLSGSASLRDKRLTLTVVNPHVSEPRETEVVVRNAEIRSCRARILTANDIHAHNTFDDPRRVEPRDEDVSLSGKTLVYRFAPASVTRLQLDLA